jgi:glycerol-3-phosphate acyltransferase PlsY
MPEVTASTPMLLAALVGGYLMGSVLFGFVLSKLMRLGDLRQIGSGNLGATNVLRTGNKLAAFLTLLFDGAKAAAAVLVFGHWGEAAGQIAGLGAFVGHCYPVWLRFRGGKGVATFIGLMLALAWPWALLVCLAWLAGAGLSRMSSAGALTAAAASPVILAMTGHGDAVALAIALALLVFWRHRANIQRILRGQEPRIGGK